MSRAMKNSGIPWIGEIPSHWRKELIGSCIKEVNNPNTDNAEDNALQFKMGTIISKKGGDSKYNPETLEAYNKVRQGDIIINGLNLSFDFISQRVGLVKENGVITSTYLALRPLPLIDSRFLNYLFKGYDYCKALHSMGRGLRATLGYNEFRKYSVVFPSIQEQQAIADYLDKKCSEIDKMVSLQEKIIEELKAYKQSVITETVCKGLNPDVPMKDSGIEWAGKIPKHWEVKRVKYLSNTITKGNGITKEEVFSNGDTPCVRYGEIYSKYNNSFKECLSATNIDIQAAPRFFSKGDILCAGTGELVEEIGKSVVYLGEERCLAGGDIIVINHNQNPLFLNFALNSNYAQTQKSKGKAKLKVVHISASEIGSILIALPPKAEQEQIAEYLNEKNTEIDTLISLKQSKIDALKEYKKTIIYEYITGKKEVNA